MRSLTPAAVLALAPDDFDEFLCYLNDHLSDNGKTGGAYFQPLPRSESSFPAERAAAFRAGLSIPVGQAGWRRLWVARGKCHQIIGHIDLRGHAERHTEHRCLLGMGIAQAHRRTGLGTRLLEHAQAWAQDHELLEWIDLQVLSANQPAIRLYERAGFEKVGEIPAMFRIDGLSLSLTAMTRQLGKVRGGRQAG